MYKRILFLVYCIFLWVSMLHGQPSANPLVLEAGPTFNRSDLSWSIAGNMDGESPNILSELEFNKIISMGYYLHGHYMPIDHLTFSAYYQRNKVFDGHGLDTDYGEDNRTNPTFEEDFISDQGHLTNLKGGIGYTIPLSKKMEITPTLSYYSKKQKFYLLSHQKQDLESTYLATMQGINLSVESELYVNKDIFLSLALSYQVIDYTAEANWNLRDIFQHPLSFTHSANGAGLGVDAEVGYDITKRIAAVISGDIHTMTIREGTDTAYLASGQEEKTQFNGANSVGCGLRVGLTIAIW